MDLLSYQYELVRDSRRVVFDFCKKMSPDDYVRPVSNFGRGGTMRNLQTHTANAYIFWLAGFTRQTNPSYFKPESIAGPAEMEKVFAKVDEHVNDFLIKYKSDAHAVIEGKIPNYEKLIRTTPLLLLTHVITHEFHHKGQIMTMTRILGYRPPDTDIMRLDA